MAIRMRRYKEGEPRCESIWDTRTPMLGVLRCARPKDHPKGFHCAWLEDCTIQWKNVGTKRRKRAKNSENVAEEDHRDPWDHYPNPVTMTKKNPKGRTRGLRQRERPRPR